MGNIKLIANNKRAFHDYFISDTYEAGIVLEGSEAKSVRNGSVSINESFIQIEKGELILKNSYIKQYENAKSFAPEEKRNRKLLVHKQEINKLERQIKEKSCTIIPIKVYLKGRLIKIEIGVAKGKKLYDKKNDLKEKSMKREIENAMKTR